MEKIIQRGIYPHYVIIRYDYFKQRLKAAFLKNKDENDDREIRRAIKHGKYVYSELESFYYLKKYRHLKKSYDV